MVHKAPFRRCCIVGGGIQTLYKTCYRRPCIKAVLAGGSGRSVRGPRTDRKHGCVSANFSRIRVPLGEQQRTVCVQAPPESQVFLFGEWRDIRRNNVENHWNALFLELDFWNATRRTRSILGFVPTEASPLKRGFRTFLALPVESAYSTGRGNWWFGVRAGTLVL